MHHWGCSAGAQSKFTSWSQLLPLLLLSLSLCDSTDSPALFSACARRGAAVFLCSSGRLWHFFPFLQRVVSMVMSRIFPCSDSSHHWKLGLGSVILVSFYCLHVPPPSLVCSSPRMFLPSNAAGLQRAGFGWRVWLCFDTVLVLVSLLSSSWAAEHANSLSPP